MTWRLRRRGLVVGCGSRRTCCCVGVGVNLEKVRWCVVIVEWKICITHTDQTTHSSVPSESFRSRIHHAEVVCCFNFTSSHCKAKTHSASNRMDSVTKPKAVVPSSPQHSSPPALIPNIKSSAVKTGHAQCNTRTKKTKPANAPSKNQTFHDVATVSRYMCTQMQ